MIVEPIFFTDNNTKRCPTNDNNYDILILEGIINKREKWDHYNFNGVPVPRVSELLKETIGKDYLLKWALRLGQEEYERETRDTLYTGTIVHDLIEHFLKYGTKKVIHFKSYSIRMKTERAYNNFVTWYRDMVSKGYKIESLYNELPITCPWFGGTIDCIMRITDSNGLSYTYIVDFKTSKQITIDYFLQTYAYKWMVDWNRQYINPNLPIIDGLGIIRIDKSADKYEGVFYNVHDEFGLNFINRLDVSLGSMINWFYHLINLRYEFSQGKKYRKEKENKYATA